jgi:hypothetical protein
MAAEIASVSVSADTDALASIRQAETDLKAAARTAEMSYSVGEFSVEALLGDV